MAAYPAVLSASEYEERQSLEVAVASMENRLRGTITELLQPTIQRTSAIVSDVDAMKGVVGQHTRGLQEVQLGQFKALEQVGTIASFKEEMSRWDTQRRTHEASLDEKMEAIQQRVDGYRYNLEQKESALHQFRRSVDRMANELNRVVEEQETQKDGFESRLDDTSRKISQARSEMEVRIAGMEVKHNALTDELWGEETGLAKCAGELRKTNAALVKLEADVEAVQKGKAEAAQLDRLRAEVGKMVHDANTSVATMKQTVGNVVNDVREHFRTASQTIAAHNAAFISEIREQYTEELAQAAKLRGEVEEFMVQTAKSISTLDARVAEAAARAGTLAAEAREQVEELNRRRKRDKTTTDGEIKALKRKVGGVWDNEEAVLAGIKHVYGVLNLVIDSDCVQCALDLQDSQDRKRMALVGVKDDDSTLVRTTQTEPVRPRPECRAQSAPDGQSCKKTIPGKLRGGPGSLRGKQAQQEPIRIDNRCLSCSGQAPLVLAAFKMACLQYAPSPVEHNGQVHDRSILLEKRQSLLEEARYALLQGPNHASATPPTQAEEAFSSQYSDDETEKAFSSQYSDLPEAGRPPQAPQSHREAAATQAGGVLGGVGAGGSGGSVPKLPTLNSGGASMTSVITPPRAPLTAR